MYLHVILLSFLSVEVPPSPGCTCFIWDLGDFAPMEEPSSLPDCTDASGALSPLPDTSSLSTILCPFTACVSPWVAVSTHTCICIHCLTFLIDFVITFALHIVPALRMPVFWKDKGLEKKNSYTQAYITGPGGGGGFKQNAKFRDREKIWRYKGED